MLRLYSTTAPPGDTLIINPSDISICWGFGEIFEALTVSGDVLIAANRRVQMYGADRALIYANPDVDMAIINELFASKAATRNTDWRAFFDTILPIANASDKFEKWGDHEKQLWAGISELSVNKHVEKMAEATLNYISTASKPNAHLIKNIGLKITKILNIPSAPSSKDLRENAIRPIVTKLAELRQAARNVKDKALFKLCDGVRLQSR
jgi:hypothetical protein